MNILKAKKLYPIFIILLGTVVVLVLFTFIKKDSPVVIPTPTADESEFHAYYLFNEKYAENQSDSYTEIKQWKNRLMKDFLDDSYKLTTDTYYDIFTHNGGGPLGAEWNSDGALYIVATVPYETNSISNLTFSLNNSVWNKDIEQIGIDSGRTFIATEIPGSVWQNLLAPILLFDYESEYPGEERYAIDGLETLTIELAFNVTAEKHSQQIKLNNTFKIINGE